jgi:hypothetical protein
MPAAPSFETRAHIVLGVSTVLDAAPQDEGAGTFGWQKLAALDRRNRRV